jgi:hypothetical protein
LDVILSDRLQFVGRCIDSAYRGAATVACPDKILRLLSATIAQGNVASASKLQEKRFTLDASLSLLDQMISMLNEVEVASSQISFGEAVVDDVLIIDHRFCSMVAESLASEYSFKSQYFVETVGVLCRPIACASY